MTNARKVLSANISRDPDVPSDAAQGLTFVWSCAVRNAACRFRNGTSLSFPSLPEIRVPSDALIPSVTFVFTVRVSKDVRTSFFSAAITPAPNVTGVFITSPSMRRAPALFVKLTI
jgi:hypothetical protein